MSFLCIHCVLMALLVHPLICVWWRIAMDRLKTLAQMWRSMSDSEKEVMCFFHNSIVHYTIARYTTAVSQSVPGHDGGVQEEDSSVLGECSC